MNISRRNFLKFCGANALALGISSGVLGKLEKALAASPPQIIWLQGASCSGCTISTLNLLQTSGVTDAHDLLINTVDIQYHGTIMGLAGDEAQSKMSAPPDDFILVVEGGVPTAFNGQACILWEDTNGNPVTMKDMLITLAAKASAIVCAGTCASFGGIPAAGDNPAKIKAVSEIISQDIINVPGCPVHPERLVLTLAHVIAGEEIRLLPDGASPGGKIGDQYPRCHYCHDHDDDDDGHSGSAPHQDYGRPCSSCHGSSGSGGGGGDDNDDDDDDKYSGKAPHKDYGKSCSSCHSSGGGDDDDDDDDDDYDEEDGRRHSALYSSSSYSSHSSGTCHSCHSHTPTNEVWLNRSPFDNKKVPAEFFNRPICPCSRQTGGQAFSYGSNDKCQYRLGCRGQSAFADCPSRKWHGGSSWCMAANAHCTGCVNPSFPDQSGRPLLKMSAKSTGVTMLNDKEPATPTPDSSPVLTPIINLIIGS